MEQVKHRLSEKKKGFFLVIQASSIKHQASSIKHQASRKNFWLRVERTQERRSGLARGASFIRLALAAG
jgi:hypothetical protein